MLRRKRWLSLVLLVVPLGLFLVLRERAYWRPQEVWKFCTGNGIGALVLSHDGQKLAVVNDGPGLVVLDAHQGRVLWQKEKADADDATFSPDDTYLISSELQSPLLSSRLQVRKSSDGSEVAAATTGWLGRFSPDGNFLAAGGYESQLHIWDTSRLLNGNARLLHAFGSSPYSEWIDDVAWSPDGKLLASANFSGHEPRVELWNARQWKLQSILQHKNTVRVLAWSPDGKHLAAAEEKEVVVWDIATRKPAHRWPAGSLADDYSDYTLLYAPDGQTLCTRYEYFIRFWDAKTGSLQREIKSPRGTFSAGQFSRDGHYFWTGSSDGSVRRWRLK
jgi:WD40 repeat protein